jgi:hypothetical protein
MADLLDLIEDIFLSRTVPGASGSSKGRAAPLRGPTMAAK